MASVDVDFPNKNPTKKCLLIVFDESQEYSSGTDVDSADSRCHRIVQAEQNGVPLEASCFTRTAVDSG